MRALEFITGHVIYNPAYTYTFHLKTTLGSSQLADHFVNEIKPGPILCYNYSWKDLS